MATIRKNQDALEGDQASDDNARPAGDGETQSDTDVDRGDDGKQTHQSTRNVSVAPRPRRRGSRKRIKVELIKDAGQDRLDATVGSALDIFGGNGVTYEEVVAFHRAQQNG